MNQVNFELVGAASYRTLKESFVKGAVYGTTEELWEGDYKLRTNPAAPDVALFAKVSPIYEDMRAAGLLDESALSPSAILGTGELDTGAGNGNDSLDPNTPDGSDLSDLDEDDDANGSGNSGNGETGSATGTENTASTTDNPGDGTQTPAAGSEGAPAGSQAPSSAPADSSAKPSGRRVVVTPTRKSVTV